MAEEARAAQFGLHPQRQRAHKFPLSPVPDPPNAVPGKQWYACDRCGCTFSEASPTIIVGALPCDPAPDQGERDGLAERLEARADEEEGLRPANPTNLRAADTLRVGRAEAFREAAQMARDESSTEGAARPGDSPLNDTRTNSDRPWREDVARAFVTNRPAQPEGAARPGDSPLNDTRTNSDRPWWSSWCSWSFTMRRIHDEEEG